MDEGLCAEKYELKLLQDQTKLRLHKPFTVTFAAEAWVRFEMSASGMVMFA